MAAVTIVVKAASVVLTTEIFFLTTRRVWVIEVWVIEEGSGEVDTVNVAVCVLAVADNEKEHEALAEAETEVVA